MKFFGVFILVILLFQGQNIQAQCTPAGEPSGSCSGGNGAATNGQNINGGETYWYASSGSFTNLSINGGTLRVCGDLTLNNLSYNSGTIIVEAGGSLIVEASLNLNGNTSITNYGVLSFLGSVTMQNASNVIVNKSGATLNMQNFELQLNSNTSRVINEGMANMGTLRIQSNNGGLCMGDNATLNAVDIFNNGPNSIEFPAGANSCISFSGIAQLNQPVTNSDRVFICQATGATTTGGSDFGSATVITECTGCAAVALPAELVYFRGRKLREKALLFWHTLNELNNDYFEVERSEDGIHFQTVSQQVPGKGNGQVPHHYQWVDPQPKQGVNYYRLKQVDTRQNELPPATQYSKIIALNFRQAKAKLEIYPTAAVNYINLTTQQVVTDTKVTITNALGQVIEQLSVKNELQQIPIKHYPVGVYIVRISLPKGVLMQRFIKL